MPYNYPELTGYFKLPYLGCASFGHLHPGKL